MSWYNEHGYDPDLPDAPEREEAPARTCRVCGGKGEIKSDCRRCDGYNQESGIGTCRHCDVILCNDCETDIAEQIQGARDERERLEFELAHAPGKV